MNPRGTLQEIIGALLSMNPEQIVSATMSLETMQNSPADTLLAEPEVLRCAADLARASSALWADVCERAALASAGYCALGTPAEQDANQTGVLCG